MTIEKQTGGDQTSPGGASPPSAERDASELLRENALLKERVARLEESEAGLKETESQFREAQRIARLGSWEREIRTGRIRASDEFWRIFFGRVPEESEQVYTSVLGRVHPEDRDTVRGVVAKAPKDRKPFNLEFRITPREGRERIVYARGEVVFDEAGEPVKVRGIAQDISKRKRAEEELRRQKEILQKIFDHAPVMICFFDEEMRLDLVNPEWERRRGWFQEEIRRQKPDVMAQAYPDPQYRNEVFNFIAAAEGEWADFQSRSQDGRIIDVTWCAVRLSDGTRLTMGADITRRKRAEAENQRLLRELGERVKELTALHGASRLLQNGWADTHSLLLELASLLPPAFRRPEFTAVRFRLGCVEAATPGFADSPSALRSDFLTADGQPGSIEVVSTAVGEQAGASPFVVEEQALVDTIVDMLRTAYDRRQAESALRESNELLRQLTENIREVFWVRTPEAGKVLYVSPMYEIIWGRTCQSLYEEPKSFLEAVHPEDLGRVIDTVADSREGGYEIEYRIVTPDGGLRWLHTRAFPVRDGAGRVYRLAGIAEDITERKRVEEAVRESEARFRAFFEETATGNAIGDLQGRILESNRTMREMLGYSSEELSRMRFTDFSHPDSAGSELSLIQELFAGDRNSYQIEKPCFRKDGELIWVRVTVSLIRDGGGNPLYLCGSAANITERRRAEGELRRQKEILQKIFDHIPLLISILSEDIQVRLVNREWERVLGWRLEEVLNKSLDILAETVPDPDYRKRAFDFITRGQGEPSEFRLITREGLALDVSWTTVRLEDGMIIGIGQDVTERRRSESALRQSERDYRTLFEQAHDAILIFEPEGEIILNVNRRACEVYGYSKDELVGMSLERLTRDILGGKRQIKKTLKIGRYYQFESVQYRSDGSLMHLEINASVIEYEGQRVILSINRDVTDRKRAEEERNVLMRRLLSAHEDERHRISRELHDHMGQYLAALMMGIKAIQRDEGLTPEVRERVVRLQELTTQFSGAVRHFALELRPTVLDDVGLEAALTNYIEEWARLSEVRVDFHCSGLSKRRLPAQVETTLYRIVQEALNNVLKHAQARRVSLIIESRPGRVVAVLEDDGVGFDVAAALGAPVSARGLGLTSMRERVESVGGALEIESRPSGGTTVVVRVQERVDGR
jgi:PAS domain S-box-containing protein